MKTKIAQIMPMMALHPTMFAALDEPPPKVKPAAKKATRAIRLPCANGASAAYQLQDQIATLVT